MGAVFRVGAGWELHDVVQRRQDRDGCEKGQQQDKRDRPLKEAEHGGSETEGLVVVEGEELIEVDTVACGSEYLIRSRLDIADKCRRMIQIYMERSLEAQR